jgi:hypothetical protein
VCVKYIVTQITTTNDLRTKLVAAIPNDDQFRQVFETATVSKAVFARYYLRSLELAAKNENSPWFIPNDDKQVINLEHVLPERPEGNWPSFTDDAVRANVKRIGNLALMVAKPNSDLKSSDFATKKDVYKDSPYETTKMLAEFDDWNEEAIERRQRILATLAVKAWPL